MAAINTIQSVMGINLDTLRPEPCVEGYSTPGGYSCKAVKPIALAKARREPTHPTGWTQHLTTMAQSCPPTHVLKSPVQYREGCNHLQLMGRRFSITCSLDDVHML